MKKISFKTKMGYTIIETMIAVSLFIVIIMAGMGALLNANLLHQKSQNMRSIMDSLSFVMEDMSRNLRTGYNYHCITGSDLLTTLHVAQSGQNCWGIAFESTNGLTTGAGHENDQWVYLINNGRVLKKTQGPYNVDASYYVQLTPEEVIVDITASNFSVLGAGAPNQNPPPLGDQQQPFIIIRLVGTITYKSGTVNRVVTPFSLQTSVSQRLLDI